MYYHIFNMAVKLHEQLVEVNAYYYYCFSCFVLYCFFFLIFTNLFNLFVF